MSDAEIHNKEKRNPLLALLREMKFDTDKTVQVS